MRPTPGRARGNPATIAVRAGDRPGGTTAWRMRRSLKHSLRHRLAERLLVDRLRFVIRFPRGGALRLADLVLLRVPAGLDGVDAPLGAPLARADRLAADFDPDRVRVDRRQDADGDPAR